MRCLQVITLAATLTTPAWADFRDGKAAYNRGDYTEAVQEFQPLAEKGDVKAQYWLGAMYTVGFGVPQDDVFAHMWFNLAAGRGSKAAALMRETAAETMTPNDLALARKLAREWLERSQQK